MVRNMATPNKGKQCTYVAALRWIFEHAAKYGQKSFCANLEVGGRYKHGARDGGGLDTVSPSDVLILPSGNSEIELAPAPNRTALLETMRKTDEARKDSKARLIAPGQFKRAENAAAATALAAATARGTHAYTYGNQCRGNGSI